jgi:hypothetical protein
MGLCFDEGHFEQILIVQVLALVGNENPNTVLKTIAGVNANHGTGRMLVISHFKDDSVGATVEFFVLKQGWPHAGNCRARRVGCQASSTINSTVISLFTSVSSQSSLGFGDQ